MRKCVIKYFKEDMFYIMRAEKKRGGSKTKYKLFPLALCHLGIWHHRE